MTRALAQFSVRWEVGLARGPLLKDRSFFTGDDFSESALREIDRLQPGEAVRLGGCVVTRLATPLERPGDGAVPVSFSFGRALDQHGAEGENKGHGHVFPRPDGVKARCGGPSFCGVCAFDAAAKASSGRAVSQEARGHRPESAGVLHTLIDSFENTVRSYGEGNASEELLESMRDRVHMLVDVLTTTTPTSNPRLANGAGLHPLTADLVARFASALEQKLANAERKYGYSDGWCSADWESECRAHLVEHIAKGDPLDVAAYCAFMWHHGWSTAGERSPDAQPEISREAWIAAAQRVYIACGDDEKLAHELAVYQADEQDWLGEDIGDPYETALEDIEGRPQGTSNPSTTEAGEAGAAEPLRADEVLIAIRRPEDYEDVHPQLVAEDAFGTPDAFEWRVVPPSSVPAPQALQPQARQDEQGGAA